MSTQCIIKQPELKLGLKSLKLPNSSKTRKVFIDFKGGKTSSNGGAALLREIEAICNILKRLSHCFHDYRDQSRVTHSVLSMLTQRIIAICCGYEDINDHEELRNDPVLQLCCERLNALAGKSTLNRLELSANIVDRYKKIVADFMAIDKLLVRLFMESFRKEPKEIVLDIDITDDPLHGDQEGKFYHGYYRGYCYAPSYIFCGRHLLGCRLRVSNQDSAAGAKQEIERIVSQIRRKWKKTRIIIRGDSGFCRENLMKWCEDNRVDYVFGIASNTRLKKIVQKEMKQAQEDHSTTQEPARRFASFEYRTLDSWSRSRRVVCKAEHLSKGANPRFIVTSLSSNLYNAKTMYEKMYCARGEMENRIKAQQLELFADRTSTHYMPSNQLRMYLSAFAYIILEVLRREGLKGTRYEMAQCHTIRLMLLKIGTVVKMSMRRVRLSFPESYPHAELFSRALEKLQGMRTSYG